MSIETETKISVTRSCNFCYNKIEDKDIFIDLHGGFFTVQHDENSEEPNTNIGQKHNLSFYGIGGGREDVCMPCFRKCMESIFRVLDLKAFW